MTDVPDVACVSLDSRVLHRLSQGHGVMECGVVPDYMLVGRADKIAGHAERWCDDCFPDHSPLTPREWATIQRKSPQ